MVNEIFGGTAGRLAYEPPGTLGSYLGTEQLRILDLGGNVGVFALFALGRWQVDSVMSVEPDPSNADLLCATVAANPEIASWSVRHAAVSNINGTMRFVADRLSESRPAEAGEQGVLVEMVDLFSLDHDVHLLKMDIEGGEWPILQDPRLGSLGAQIIVMEWHWRFCPTPDPHASVTAALRNAGYDIAFDLPSHDERTGLLWATRPNLTIPVRSLSAKPL
jgi:FkbM family methyltransferase